MKFPIRLDGVWRAPLLVIGATPKRAFVEIEGDVISCRYGWWRDRIALADIVSAKPMPWRWYWGIGMRIAPDRTLGLIGSTKGVVVMQLQQERVFKVPFKMRFRHLAVSLEDPDAFMTALRERLDGSR